LRTEPGSEAVPVGFGPQVGYVDLDQRGGDEGMHGFL
jgi:hypothetical protein